MNSVGGFRWVVLAVLAWALPPGAVLAQDGYPSKPVRLIAPYPPGGTTDVMCRLIGNKLSSSFGRQVIVENRPGAAGSIGHEVAAKSAGDGYTLVLTTKGALTVNPYLYKKLPYDPLPDVPTMAEAGVKEEFPTQWWGLAAPKGTPRPIVDRVNGELAKIVKAPDVLERFETLGVFPEHTTPERMLEIVRTEGPAMGKLLMAAGVRAN